MYQKLSSFIKNDKVIVKSILFDNKSHTFLESLGIFEGATLWIFHTNSANMILKIGKTKLAISKKIAETILVIPKT